MGCFGYICKHCGTSIRGDCFSGGEKCVLIHVRHGEELGRVEGHYNEYGGVIEQNGMDENIRFRGDGIGQNSHEEICDSEFRQPDSYDKVCEMCYYNGRVVDFSTFCKIRCVEDIKSVDYNIEELPYFEFIKECCVSDKGISYSVNKYYNTYLKQPLSLIDKQYCEFLIGLLVEELVWVFFKKDDCWFKKWFTDLEPYILENYSGIVAYHSKCYNHAIKDGSFNLIPSLYDPDQSWGKVRKKYC